MRQNARNKGFTLIELLIVIAIIGILAAVLIPNLMSARRLAQERAAQSYSAQVYTAINAWMAESIQNDFSHDNWPTTCYTEGTGFVLGSFSVNDPGSAVSNCTVNLVGTPPTDFEVVVTSLSGTTYTNGQE